MARGAAHTSGRGSWDLKKLLEVRRTKWEFTTIDVHVLVAYTVTCLPHVLVAFPTDFLHIAHYDWLPFGYDLAAHKLTPSGTWEFEVPLDDRFLLNDYITMACCLKWVIFHTAQLTPHLTRLGVKMSIHLYCLLHLYILLYLGVELSCASLCVRLSEHRHMMIIQLVQA